MEFFGGSKNLIEILSLLYLNKVSMNLWDFNFFNFFLNKNTIWKN